MYKNGKLTYSCPGDAIVKEKDTGISYGQQKPIKLYEKLLHTLKAGASLYVIDAYSGVEWLVK